MNADGSSPIRLTHTVYEVERPLVSPDGLKILFQSTEGVENFSVIMNIYMMNTDGTNLVNLTRYQGQNLGASFAPMPARTY